MVCLRADFLNAAVVEEQSSSDPSISGPFQVSLHTSDATSRPGTSL